MILDPSWDLAERTMLGELYASLVTQVQWKVYEIRKKVIMPTKNMAMPSFCGYADGSWNKF